MPNTVRPFRMAIRANSRFTAMPAAAMAMPRLVSAENGDAEQQQEAHDGCQQDGVDR